ncbi:HNH endonuclease signature motif containing protein, partial [Actinomycetospora atypica]
CALDPDEHPATTTRDRDQRLPRTALARWIDARDHQCVAPGCSKLARRCDHDHTLDWQYGGRTQADELANLCRHHHRGKHTGRWHYTQPDPGRFQVTDPTGTVHHTASRVTNPLPGPVARRYPYPWHLLDLDPAKPRPDFEPRPNRDGIITDKAIQTSIRLGIRAATKTGRVEQPTEDIDDTDPPF